MAFTVFSKKEERDRNTWVNREERTRFSNGIQVDAGEEYAFLSVAGKKVMLPIVDICNISETCEEGEAREYMLNNQKVAVILDTNYDMRAFFRLPDVVPESLVYYNPGCLLAIASNRQEIISFCLGSSDSPFLISNYGVCARIEGCEDICRNGTEIEVLHRDGVTVLPACTSTASLAPCLTPNIPETTTESNSK